MSWTFSESVDSSLSLNVMLDFAIRTGMEHYISASTKVREKVIVGVAGGHAKLFVCSELKSRLDEDDKQL